MRHVIPIRTTLGLATPIAVRKERDIELGRASPVLFKRTCSCYLYSLPVLLATSELDFEQLKRIVSA